MTDILLSPITYVLISVIISLVLITKTLLNMIEEREIEKFMPFFVWGFSTALLSGFMFFGFFGKAIDLFLVIKLSVVIAFLFILRRHSK